MSRFSKPDLPARSARYARANALIGLALILLSIVLFGLMHVLGGAMFLAAAVPAVLSLPVSIAAMFFHRRCLSPRPMGPPCVLLASIALCAAYASLFFMVMGLAGMH